MKKVTKILAAFILSICIFSSCKKDNLFGSGSIESQERTVSAFTKVKTDGDIDVIILQGTTQKVVASDYGNLINDLETIVMGDELFIRYRNNKNILNSKSKVTITMPLLNAVYTSGSADINVIGTFVAPSVFTATTRGSGDISLNAITAIDFNIIVVGSGDVAILNSNTKNTYIYIDGSGDVNAFGLQAENVTVEVKGSGDAKVSASILLNAVIRGSSDIYYRGNPIVNKTITGSGRVIRQ
jgi:Putative auto-transporter adhesin, head GIN domain